MSDLKIGIVCEGITDFHVISRIVELIYGDSIISQLLQPEMDEINNSGSHGAGWGGVFRWCRSTRSQDLLINLLYSQYDIIVIHVDADVVGMSYQNINITVDEYDFVNEIPCTIACPPVSHTSSYLKNMILRWLEKESLPPKWIFCIPSKSIESWVVASKYHNTILKLKPYLECDASVENWLSQRPKIDGDKFIQSGKKKPRIYQNFSSNMKDSDWFHIKSICSQADEFGIDVAKSIH